jgi:hypothetical protein
MSQQAVGLHVIRPPDRKIDVMLSWLPILRSIIQVNEATEDMKTTFTIRNAVFVLVILVLISAVPYSLQYAYQHGGFYLFSRRFLEDLPKRLTGPGRFRFILQPAVAVFLGIRAGISDARARRPPYIMGILVDPQGRRALLKEAFEQLAVLIAMSILLDAISQFLILHEVFPGPAVIVGPVLIALPYSLARAVTNRIVGHPS